MTKVIEIQKTCFLCSATDKVVEAVTQSPYGYDVCAECYRSDIWEFNTDYS